MLKAVFAGGSFAKGCEFLFLSLGEGFGVGFKGGGGGWVGFPVENEGKGEGGGEGGGVGWGQAKEPASQCARICQNYPLAKYPLVSSEKRKRVNCQRVLHVNPTEKVPLSEYRACTIFGCFQAQLGLNLRTVWIGFE